MDYLLELFAYAGPIANGGVYDAIETLIKRIKEP